MNRIDRLLLLAILIYTVWTPHVHSQDAAANEEEKRVQYQLVLPDEKTPENVMPEEHNPFESVSEAQNRLAPGETEENRVRDKLLKLPVVGVKRMKDGRMRVLLGNIILETGGVVPPVLSEQLVELRVKNITAQYVELAWQEKRATGLPPKLMIIPINISPKVRYQMLGQIDEGGKSPGGVNATMELPIRDFPEVVQNAPPAPPPSETPPPRALFVEEDPAMPAQQSAKEPAAPPAQAVALKKPAVPPTEPAPEPAPAPAVESVVRMLFGTQPPPPK